MNQDMALLCINEQGAGGGGALGDGGWLQMREGGKGKAKKVFGHVAGQYMAAGDSF